MEGCLERIGKDEAEDEDLFSDLWEDEAERGYVGRFGAGLPRTSDGQLLFLQHMISTMKKPEDGGSRITIALNGSLLFTGGAGSGL